MAQRTMNTLHWVAFAVVLLWCVFWFMDQRVTATSDRFTGSQGAVVQMQINALQMEMEQLQEGR